MPSEPSDALCKTVYAHAGAALYFAQVFEESLTVLLCGYARINNNFSEQDQYVLYEEGLRTKTLGALLKRTKQFTFFSEEAERLIDRALENRNFLAHHFFKDHAADWFSEEGCQRMIDRLQDIRETFQLAEVLVGKMEKSIFRKLGFTEEHEAEALAEIKRKAEQGAAANP